MIDLSTTYMGIPLKNPIVPSASPLSAELDTIKRMEDAGAAAVTLPSLFEEQVEFEAESLSYFLELGTYSYAEALTYFPPLKEFRRGPKEYVEHIRQACEASLRRLNTDYIDLYYFHKDDYDPGKAAEVRDFLEKLVEEGKIRWYGWSTVNPEGARVFAQGQHCTAIQHWMNMGTDMPEMLAICDQYDLASVVRSPLGSGNMTGKFTRDSRFPQDDWRRDWNSPSEFLIQRRQRVAEIGKFFAETGDARTLAQIALAWIWTRSDRTIPIPGFKTVAQVKENIQAMEFGLLSNEQMKRIEETFGRTPVTS